MNAIRTEAGKTRPERPHRKLSFSTTGTLFLTALSLSALLASAPASAATLKRVQSGTLYFSAAGSSTSVNNRSVTIDAVNREKSVLFFTVMPANNVATPEGAWIRCTLTSDTKIACNRSLPGRFAPGRMKVQWRVVEFSSGVKVQHLMADCTGITTTIPIPTPVAAMDKSFILFSGTTVGTVQQSWRSARLSSNTAVKVEFTEKIGAGARGCHGNYAVQVVEHDDVTVTRGLTSMGQGSSSRNVAGLSAVDPSKTLLLYSWQLLMTDSGHSAERNAQIVGKLSDTSIDFSRWHHDGQITKIRWQRIEFHDGSWVQHHDVTLPAGVDLLVEPCLDIPLATPVVESKSAILTGAMQSGPNGFRSGQIHNDTQRYLLGLEISNSGESFSVCRSNAVISVVEHSGHVAVIQFDQCGNGVLDAGEQCDPGANSDSDCCTNQCTFEPSTFTCREAATGGCDLAEQCSGTSVDCPQDSVEPADTVCRASRGECDAEETCDGTSGVCPSDLLASAETICRDTDGGCDLIEKCDGLSVDCPADAFAAADTVCRAAGGLCDVAESCTGTTAECPSDEVFPEGNVCRAATGECDFSEACNGSDKLCPGDQFLPNGQLCADDGLVCNGSASCTNGACIPSLADLDCDDNDPCTDDSCNEPGGCNFAPIAGCCTTNTDCDDGNACTQDTCNGQNSCENVAIAGCCNLDNECDDGDSCTKDKCNLLGNGLGGSCGASFITGCCNAASDCDDGNSCTQDTCANNQCVSTGIANCCQQNADCDDGNACTENVCDVASGACSASPVAECCLSDGDCGDSNSCTADTCDLLTNTCVFAENADCCTADTDCDDNNVCTQDSCDASKNQCENTEIGSCCQADSDCDDGQACTADSCDLATNTCTTSVLSSCCDTASDCDDGNSCTLDSCSNNQCRNSEMADCCQQDADCNDGKACTTDTCDVASGKCDFRASESCCQADLDCSDGNSCTTNTCDIASGTCRAEAVADCCQADSECSDGNTCTQDTCDNNQCQNVAMAGCCKADADCNDGNACSLNTCNVVSGTCETLPVADCCLANTDCDDNNACTTNSCDTKTSTCVFEATEAGCCLADSDCEDNNACTANSCDLQTNTCVFEASEAGCCLADADCDDGNACTADTCDLGSNTCKNENSCYCGNGSLDVGEACDTAIPEGEEGACPTDCDDGKSCTEEKLLGTGCDARCEVKPMTSNSDAKDGCCPAGLTRDSDPDCLPLCEADVEGDCVQPCGPDNTEDNCVDLCEGVQCSEDEICIMGSCRGDQCKDVVCPVGQSCENGRCFESAVKHDPIIPGDGEPGTDVPSPPAGCDCTVNSASGAGGIPAALILVLLGITSLMRRRTVVG
jgi:hypothetical protein